jgi:hypothetical protein
MAKLDPEILAHLEWLGFVRPTGLVVSAPALVRAGAILDRRDAEGQRLVRACAADRTFDPKEGPVPHLFDFRAFAESVLSWSFSPKGYAGTGENQIPLELEVPLPDYGETLRPDFAVRELEPKEGASPWQLLVRVLEPGDDFDRVVRHGGHLEASAHGRMERLLRQTGVPAGLLFNGSALRLLSAPRGESSGWLDFRVADMVQAAGRPISTALRLLLGQPRLLSLPRAQRLAALLEDSRKFQNEVSERLAQQVLHALYELLRGFQAAHDASKGELLRQPLAEQPDEIYRALLTVILRLVFLLYAEERDMLPGEETFLRYYSLGGLYERLREDAALFPDTMDQRFGAWVQLLVLFRMIHDGAESGDMRLPKRHGVLFDPDRFNFIEGRPAGVERGIHERIEPPLVPDGTIYRALEKLLILDGERISYRALDVEQIGSVYETMMGFRLESATGRSVAIKPQKKQGAPTALDLEALLREPGSKREKWIAERTNRKFTDTVKKRLRQAATLEEVHAALLPAIDLAATPDMVSQGAMLLQPSEERRISGSHYTPRALTEPIVRTTLEPILKHMCDADGRPPRPAQILDLKVCDPAMGSGAFLVEACRQLGDALVSAWHTYEEVPAIPADEDEVIFARRLVAQRCLYGVDKNSMAVDLAKVSLWLVTLARDHALTFIDHALRHGDSLVGLSRKQIEAFHWARDAPRFQAGFETMQVHDHVAKTVEIRQRIREASEGVSDFELRTLWDDAGIEMDKVRLCGDLVLAAYFSGEKPMEREAKRSEYARSVINDDTDRYHRWLAEWRDAEKPFAPFHWEIEFPEVFERENPGFDVVIGNPPFAGGNKISALLGNEYLAFIKGAYPSSGQNSDLVGYFFAAATQLLRRRSTLGFTATNTVAQGDTRPLAFHCVLSGDAAIYSAVRSKPWPGRAALHISVVHLRIGDLFVQPVLDGKHVATISTRLWPAIEAEPSPLIVNRDKSFVGSVLLGQGWYLDPETARRLAASVHEPSLVLPFLNGEDLNQQPDRRGSRFTINLPALPLSECEKRWPVLVQYLREVVKPQRAGSNRAIYRERWWLHAERQTSLYASIAALERVLAISNVSKHFAVAFCDPAQIFDHNLTVFAFASYSALALLQSRVHDIWAEAFSSTLENRRGYRRSDCFETFPFPVEWEEKPELEEAGTAYDLHRDALIHAASTGLTKVYNRFHDPEERDPEIEKLRELHSAMDRAALDAYSWTDVSTDCKFLLDYEIDEDEWSDKKKPYRYRWPDEVRDEVLARLLELNAERAKEEARSGAAATKNRSKKPAAKRVAEESETKDLF